MLSDLGAVFGSPVPQLSRRHLDRGAQLSSLIPLLARTSRTVKHDRLSLADGFRPQAVTAMTMAGMAKPSVSMAIRTQWRYL